MDFIEQLSKKISQVSQEAVEKTKNIADTVKINALITNEENKINSAYLQIGKIYVKNYAELEDKKFTRLIDMIEEANNKIEVLKVQKANVKNGSDFEYDVIEVDEPISDISEIEDIEKNN